MKKSIVKAIILCTMAMSLLIAGANAMHTVDSGVSVCHDGPLDDVARK